MSDENIGRIERAPVQGIMTKHLPKLAETLGMTVEDLKRTMVVPPGHPLLSQRRRRVTLQLEAVEFERLAAVAGRRKIGDVARELLLEALAQRRAAAPDTARRPREILPTRKVR